MTRIRLKDIAQLANVSETTVSLVLNNAPSRISESKRAEIKQIALDLNYRPSHIARSLSMQKTQSIGLIIPDIENPYFSSMSKAIEDLLRQKGYLVFIVNSDDKAGHDIDMLHTLTDRDVDGLLICMANGSYANPHQLQSFLKTTTTPFVLIDRVFADVSFNQVSYDNELGGYLATQSLIKRGCTKIACLTGNLKTLHAQQRYMGYQRALTEASLPLLESAVFEGDFRFETGYRIGKRLCHEPLPFDGLFASNDFMAYGLMKAMKEATGSHALALVGYDNLKQSEMFGIALPSVAQDIDKISKQAIKQLLAQIKNPSYQQVTVLKPKFIKE